MQFEGALLREQGVKFAIVIVKQHVLNCSTQATKTSNQFRHHFACPIVLMAQDARGVPSYRGRRDLVRFLANVPMRAIPWKKFTLN